MVELSSPANSRVFLNLSVASDAWIAREVDQHRGRLGDRVGGDVAERRRDPCALLGPARGLLAEVVVVNLDLGDEGAEIECH